jgi:UDP-N-acetylmuramoyl-tripeptide--D-alanyl-D-alanine ligase
MMMDTVEAARAVGGRLHGGNAPFDAVSTDSRAVGAGDLFIALKGERFDGHEYVPRAEGQGAAASVVARPVEGARKAQVVVDDTRLALGRLASYWRGKFTLPLVALTGSNGKTTVKEMIAAVLATHVGARDPVLATEGNLNNDIGMPLTLLELRGKHRYAVIEMGMNHAGEIDYLTRLAHPAVALVNNAQRAHVGLLGSVEAIARAKGEIYAGLDADGVAVVNEDDSFAAYWKSLNPGRRIVSFGLSEGASVRGRIDGARVQVTTPDSTFGVKLQVAGEHNVRNALAACAACHALGIPATAMQAALERFAGVPGRLQRRPAPGGGWVIDDTYNANPESMKAAVKVLAAEKGRRVFVMGDMGELGSDAPAMHAEVGEFAREQGIDLLIAVGPASVHAARAFGDSARHFDAVDGARDAAKAEAAAGATVLVKGSRFMQMERVADAIAAPGGSNAA